MFPLLVFVIITSSRAQNGSEYLENAIKSLRKTTTTPKIPTLMSDVERKADESKKDVLPTLSLAKNELADYYETAVKKGNTLKIGTPTGDLNAAVYELPEEGASNPDDFRPNLDDPSGYYYYYYPLKTFASHLSSINPTKEDIKHKNHIHDVATETYYNDIGHSDTLHQFHTHTHQHNIHIIEKPTEMKPKKKGLEPLFMAISGFIGMSVMFVLSMLILPKFGHVKPKKGVNPEDGGLAKVIYQAIEGYDCSERLSCEFGKTTRAFNVHNNRFFKLLRRIGPKILSKQLYNINKYSNKKHKCAQIQCKAPTLNATSSLNRPIKGKS
ncbi:uncharacterized protein [Onthophagus taurus]|uniref:uncharacterized protein n=1 Tax=Onthophagus taurus TaxID=166361 RepID=UPI000C20EE13|nr:uncharacterized protein LOC111425143 [Onthophagus taurus]